jgi:hypothetical protein
MKRDRAAYAASPIFGGEGSSVPLDPAHSNVEYTVTVTDSNTGAKRTYTNPSGRFASVADTQAF